MNEELGVNIPQRYNLYKSDLIMYLSIQKRIKASLDNESYKESIHPLVGKTLTVPVCWIKEQIEVFEDLNDEKFKKEPTMQLWKDMIRDSVLINDVLYRGDESHGPERIIGALSRCILDFDRKFSRSSEDKKNLIT